MKLHTDPTLIELCKRFFNENWGKVITFILATIFAAGMTYGHLQGQVNTNTKSIQEIKGNISTQLDEINRKVDDINKYLRDHK